MQTTEHFHSNARLTGEIRGYFCGYQNSSNRKDVLGFNRLHFDMDPSLFRQNYL